MCVCVREWQNKKDIQYTECYRRYRITRKNKELGWGIGNWDP